MRKNKSEKAAFAEKLKNLAESLGNKITSDGEWTIWGFIDIFKNIYIMSSETNVISKILELHLFPYFKSFAEENLSYRSKRKKQKFRC